jgi:tetratricopeptide (TPR) repeat protein
MKNQIDFGLRCLLIALLFVITAVEQPTCAQSGLTLWGEVNVKDAAADIKKPLSLTIVLYNLGGIVVGRQTIPSGGRYRFNNMRAGEYNIAVEVETNEIARVPIMLGGMAGSDFRHDLEFEWKAGATSKSKVSTVSAADMYNRPEANVALFRRAQAAVDSKKYDEAVTLLRQVVERDEQDFQAWTELGTAYLFKQNYEESEDAYLRAIKERPAFFLAHLNLGRLRFVRKNFDAAIESLTEAVKLQPTSADANYYLGQSYLQVKKGSKAVGYLYEALRLDPIGRAEIHLSLGALYNAAGLKEKAAAEYQAFLQKKPDYPDRKKLEQYIAANKTPAETKKP